MPTCKNDDISSFCSSAIAFVGLSRQLLCEKCKQWKYNILATTTTTTAAAAAATTTTTIVTGGREGKRTFVFFAIPNF